MTETPTETPRLPAEEEQALELMVNPRPTPGVKTTEFWLVLAANVIAVTLTTLGGMEAEWAVAVVGPLNLAYTVLRTYLKRRTSEEATRVMGGPLLVLLCGLGLGVTMCLTGCQGLTGSMVLEPGAEHPTLVLEYEPPVMKPTK